MDSVVDAWTLGLICCRIKENSRSLCANMVPCHKAFNFWYWWGQTDQRIQNGPCDQLRLVLAWPAFLYWRSASHTIDWWNCSRYCWRPEAFSSTREVRQSFNKKSLILQAKKKVNFVAFPTENWTNSRLHKLFATMFHQRNMRESTHTGDTPQARFLLEKTEYIPR